MTPALTAAALDIAAVSGVFEPRALAEALGLGVKDPNRDGLWREMGGVVDEVPGADNPTSPGYGWFLNPDQRRARLEQFVSRMQLDRVLADASPLRQDDLFGSALRGILAGQSPRLSDVVALRDDAALAETLNHHAAVLDAVQFALAVPALDRAALVALEEEAKRQIQTLQRRRDLTVVLPRRHRGYATERGKLSRFLRGGTTDGRPLLLTGIGGVGKSAILARIQQGWQGRKAAPLTVILDFDRRQLNSGQPVEILSAVLRQLESAIGGRLGDSAREAEIAKRLNKLRHDLPSFTATGEQRDHGSQFSYLSSWLPGALSEPWATPLKTLPIAAIFDSFEAVDRRGVLIVETILNVESLLRTQFGALRTVVSGRAEPLEKDNLLTYFGPAQRNIRLTGLSAAAGAQLLAEEDQRLAGQGARLLTDPALCMTASRTLKGHPLALIIFAQYARTHPEDVEELVADLANNEDFRAEFAQIFLYERILDRIEDPELNRLAHPGLVLRQISADLIRFALAGPCLGEGPDDPVPMSAERARTLLNDLREEYWLVEDGKPPFDLAHRADLRRLMLPGLFAGPLQRDSAERRIEKTRLMESAVAACAAAARYFDKGPPGTAGPEAHKAWRAIDARTRRMQRFYYTSFTRPDDPEPFDEATARDMDDEIGEDIETMPLAWRARINVLRGVTPTEAELATLPPDLREIGEARRFKDEAAAGLGKSARAKPGANGTVPPQGVAPGAPAPSASSAPDRPASAYERDIQRAFAAAAFDEVARLAPDYFTALTGRPDEETDQRFRGAETDGYWRHPLWQCLLTAAAGIGADPIADAAGRHMLAESPYRPVYAAIIAAASRAPEGVTEALAPIFRRDILNPVDFNRTQGRAMTEWLTAARGGGEPKTVMSLYPNALCLAVADVGEPDSPFLLAEWLQPENEALHALRATPTPSLALLSKAFEHRAARSRQSYRAAPALPPSELGLAARVLRGLNPDLQLPLVPIVEKLPADTVERIVGDLLPRARYWPEELRFDAKRRYQPVQSNTIVETADQCGILRDLIVATAACGPEPVPILSMYDAISDWFFPFARKAAA